MNISQLHHPHDSPVRRELVVPQSQPGLLKPHLGSPASVTSSTSASGSGAHAHASYPSHASHAMHRAEVGRFDYRDRDRDPSSGPSPPGAPVDGDEPAKKKQKRNKPTLSCHECVERKTKVR